MKAASISSTEEKDRPTAAAVHRRQLQPPHHTVQTRALHAYLRWRNKNARHPDVLAAQRKERTRVRSEKGLRWGGRPLPNAARAARPTKSSTVPACQASDSRTGAPSGHRQPWSCTERRASGGTPSTSPDQLALPTARSLVLRPRPSLISRRRPSSRKRKNSPADSLRSSGANPTNWTAGLARSPA